MPSNPGAGIKVRAWGHALCEQLETRTLLSALPAGFAQTQVASGLLGVTAMTVAPDGRVFITSQDGTVRIVQNGKLLATPFLALTTSYGQAAQGIMGIALDPNFESNGYVYVDYTVGGSTSFQRISRFTASGNTAVPGSEDVLFQVGPQTSFGHIGGGLTFGSDGMLYFSYGDDNLSNIATLAPQVNNFYGKILRINPDGTIPTSNPFYNQTTGDYRAIWAYGIRQGFKMSEQSTTGLIYIADVGEGTYEDIFQGIAGANYGWPTTEGPTTLPGITPPVYSYPHTGSSTGAYSITGGFFYNPATNQFPSQYAGEYFFADWGTGQIETLNPAAPASAQLFATGAYDIVGMDAAPNGSMYYLTRGDANYRLDSPNGQLFQVSYTGSQAPSIAVQPANVSGRAATPATFSVAANGTGPFTYQWQENNSNIPGANAASYTFNPAVADNGSTFDVVVSNASGSATSTAATLSIVADSAPEITVKLPGDVSYYYAGQALAYSATATDAEFGTLPAADFSWTVDLYHDNTITAVQTKTGVTSGSYLVPTAPLNDADSLYKVSLTVTNPDGISSTAYQEVFPVASYIDVTSNIAGAQVMVDRTAVSTPYSFLSIAGTTHTIAAVSPQTVSAKTYSFTSWSDGGSASHTITTPITSASSTLAPVTTVTANYSAATAPPPPASISGTVFNDTNHDGIQDDGEAGIAGITVYQDPNYNRKLDPGEQSVVTDANGDFTFPDPPADPEILRIVLPSGATQTFPAGGVGDYVGKNTGQTLTGENFGISLPVVANASISGIVFNDVNADGVQDNGESGVAGVKVYADLGNSGTFTSSDPSATTNASGAYTVSGLPTGSYTVREVIPSGATQTSPANNGGLAVSLATSQAAARDNFGLIPPAVPPGPTISGTVFNDANHDGIQDDGETGVAGVLVYEDPNYNHKADPGEQTTITDANGDFIFTNFPADPEILRIVLPSGATQIFPAGGVGDYVGKNTGQTLTGENFGILLSTGGGGTGTGGTSTGSITGSVFNDLNGDHVQSTGEPNLAGQTVYIDANNDGKLDAGDPTAITTSAGTFTFTGLAAESYTVYVSPAAGYRQTLPISGGTKVTVTANKSVSTGAFGVTTTAYVGGTLFDDLNGNGVQNSGEADLAGYKVYIDLNNDGVFESNEPSDVTTSVGYWYFRSVAPGTYTIRVVAPSGWTTTHAYTVTLGSGAYVVNGAIGIKKG